MTGRSGLVVEAFQASISTAIESMKRRFRFRLLQMDCKALADGHREQRFHLSDDALGLGSTSVVVAPV